MNTKYRDIIAVIGLGYVGLPMALLIDKKKYKTVGLTNDKKEVELINNRKCRINDSTLQDELKKSHIHATTSYEELSDASIIIICVPTPVYKNQLPDYRPLIDVCSKLGNVMHKGQLIIVESTINPGVCEELLVPILEKKSNLKEGKDFFIAHCPERVNPGDKQWGLEKINRVIGSTTKKGLDLGLQFYRSILSGTVTPMLSIKEAEAVKILENSFRDINIAFINEMAMSFHTLGIDIIDVIKGASTKPFSFLAHYPGCGVGGHCIPVDPYYLIDYAKKKGFKHTFLAKARKINNMMPDFLISLVDEAVVAHSLDKNDTVIGLLGQSYKANIDDVRNSPAVLVKAKLIKSGFKVLTYDPYVPAMSTTPDLAQLLKKSNMLVICTDHIQFKKITPQNLLKNNINIVIDGRNCLPKEEFEQSGIYYRGIGR